MALLEVSNLTTNFHTRNGVATAVDAVSFAVDRGEILGIVGESGSGKSVCCYSLLGLIPSPPGKIESGTAMFEGQDLLAMSVRELRALRGNDIAMIFQDPMTSLNPFLTIGEQLIEPLTYHHAHSRRDARSRAIELLEEVGIQQAAARFNSYPHEFSGGMRQRVMIAMALITEPKLLIADEPTTALDVTIQAQILLLIAELQKKRNIAVIFISHDLAVVRNLADRVLVMQAGKAVEQGDTNAIFNNPKKAYTQALLAAIPGGAKLAEDLSQEQPLVKVSNLITSFSAATAGKRFRAVDQASFELMRGEILGLVGESGSGKSTLGRSVLKLVKPESGSITFAGQELMGKTAREMLPFRRQMQMIFQDPYASLNPRMTVYDTLAEPLLYHRLASRGNVEQQVFDLMDDVGMARRFVRKYPHEFSGGQRQRIAIGRAIATRPEFVVADEPVSALDVTIQNQILELLLQLVAKHNLSMLFISHDLAVVRYLCDRVMVMKRGKLLEIGNTEQVWKTPRNEYTINLLSSHSLSGI
ncbi:MAG: ABC transporter ATP-binding protein [Pseudomonadales bacterium]